MQAVVPAAGRGSRLRPLTDDRPKGLVDVAGRPVLTHCFETLVDLGVEELIAVVGYRGDDIVAHYGETFAGVPVTYTRQAERTGLADAVLTAEKHVTGDFLVMNGDNVYDADLSPVVATHGPEVDVTALVDEVAPERARQGGVFELDDGEIAGVVEKPERAPSAMIPRGFYAFSPRIFHACHLVEPGRTGEHELTDAVDLFLYAGARVEFVEFEGWCTNINTPDDRQTAEAYLSGEDG
jgi:dTDP-glucose pyrophosphorylase